MANIFDKDTASTDNHLLNEQFHAFSKSPSSPGSTLGGASNRSGHTVSASDVWAEKIPAFFYPKADSDYAVCKANAKLNDICRWGDEIQIWNGSEFIKFADNYNAIPDGWIFCNENDEPVVRFHKNRIAYNLNDVNNAYDNSLDANNKGASAKIQGWNGPVKKYTVTLDGDTITYEVVEGSMHPYVESAPNFITQFVAPTDNIVKGVPSKGYGPIVMVGGSPLTEDADSTAGYIANNFAGIIQFNERKAQGTVTVHAFEYCGKTLGNTIGNIADLESKLTPITTAITDVQTTANSKVADVKINDVSIVNETSKVASLTTTKTDIIAANASSKSTNLATEASVAKAVAKVLEDANAYSDTLHSTNLVYIVLGDNETLPEPSANTVGKIYLVKEGNTANDETDIDAISGSYVEYMTRKASETEYVWEKIGTTAADLTGYAKTITINGESKTVSSNAVDLGNVAISVTAGNGITSGTVSTGGALSLTLDEADINKKGIVQLASTHEASNTTKAATGATVASAISGIGSTSLSDNGVTVTTGGGSVTGVEVATTSLVNEGSLVGFVTDDNLITAADALAAIKLAKPENYISTVSDGETDAEGSYVNVTSGETKLVIKDGRENVYTNDLWGTTVSMVSNTITVQGGPIDGTDWGPKNGYNTKGEVYTYITYYPQGSNPITKVENNMVYNGATEVANIKTNEIVNGTNMFSGTSLESFNSDLSSLVDGNRMFYKTSLASFSGDLSSLVDGYQMFYNTSLKSFNGDLSSLVNGTNMFVDSESFESFSGDLLSLVDSNSMFFNTPLKSFSGDLSSLINGYRMFYKTPLASFSGDLSSLTNGNSMFTNTSLTSFSRDLSSLVNGYYMFSNCISLKSFNGDLSSLVNGGAMFSSTSLASFSGDLSSLVNGADMFSSTSLASFSGDLSSLVNGTNMFSNCASLTSFSGDLSSLVNGTNMFSSTSLDIESVELICDVLPNYNTENGGKKLKTATWNSSEGKYTYSDWNGTSNFYYPIIEIITDYDSMSQGNTDGINRSFDTEYISASNVKSITIKWKSGSAILGEGHEADREKIAKLFTNTATEKGWTFLVNTEIAESGEIAPPNAIMATDGTIQYYVLAKKDEATEDNATHIDASGKLWKFDTAEAIIGPNIKYWSIFATVEDALTEWGLTPWTKPTEEETEA